MTSGLRIPIILPRTIGNVGKRSIGQWCKGLSRHKYNDEHYGQLMRRDFISGKVPEGRLYRSTDAVQRRYLQTPNAFCKLLDSGCPPPSRKYSSMAEPLEQNNFYRKVTRPLCSSMLRQLPTTIQTRVYNNIAGASPRQMASLEERVWSVVTSNAIDPETNLDLQKLGWLQRRLTVSKKTPGDDSSGEKSDCTVQLVLQLPTLLHPSLDSLKCMIEEEAKKEIDRWVADNNLSIVDDGRRIDVEVKVVAKQPIPWTVQSGQQSLEDIKSTLGPGLTNVSHFLAVYSCKGGVGKSTVAVNLAYELARLGGRVGLLDVDIYGPSLPLLVTPDDDAVRRSSLGSSMVKPIEHKGVKLLSLGYVSSHSGIPGSGKKSDAAVLRGPMAGRVTTQLLKGTEWGDLDVLILDLPPGTGDVQLTVCQEINLSFAVGVTTPSNLAIADARKGISMFNSMGIETVAMVENMAYFECEGGGKHYPFGKGFAGEDSAISETYGNTSLSPDKVCQLPISKTANIANDIGIPICLSRPEGAKKELDAFEKLATIVSRELFQLPLREPSSEGKVAFDDEQFDLSTIHASEDKGSLLVRFFSENGALQKRIPSQNLRRLDPMTGVVTDPTLSHVTETETKEDDVVVTVHKTSGGGCGHNHAPDIVPERVEEKGRVGYEVTWSDGSRYIYKRKVVAIAAGGVIQ